MSEKIIEMKGSLYTLSSIRLFDSNPEKFATALSTKIAQAPGFFTLAPVVLDISLLPEQEIDFAAIADIIAKQNMRLVGVSGGTAEQKQRARLAGIAALMQSKSAPVQAKPAASPKATANTQKVETSANKVENKTIDGTVRSGQQVYAKNGDLVVMGSVSNGAEVIADGNIHIYGTLRGRAIAGATGDQSARIYCHNNQAELVSICGHYWLSDALQQSHWQQAICISLDNESLSIKSLF